MAGVVFVASIIAIFFKSGFSFISKLYYSFLNTRIGEKFEKLQFVVKFYIVVLIYMIILYFTIYFGRMK